MNESHSQVAQRIEEASLNAWPALQQQLYDGWLLRFSRGFTKRANAVVPLYPTQGTTSELHTRVRYCENLYAREGLQTVFRLTSISPYPELEPLLKARDYVLVDPTQVQLAQLSDLPPALPAASASANALLFVDREPWLEAYRTLADLPAPASMLHGALLKSIPGVTGYALLQNPTTGQPVACGLAVIESEFVGLFDIITAANARRQGHGRRLVRALLEWGQEQGASAAYLQVIANNHPAITLYQDLGFSPIYHYWYRVN